MSEDNTIRNITIPVSSTTRVRNDYLQKYMYDYNLSDRSFIFTNTSYPTEYIHYTQKYSNRKSVLKQQPKKEYINPNLPETFKFNGTPFDIIRLINTVNNFSQIREYRERIWFIKLFTDTTNHYHYIYSLDFKSLVYNLYDKYNDYSRDFYIVKEIVYNILENHYFRKEIRINEKIFNPFHEMDKREYENFLNMYSYMLSSELLNYERYI